MRKATNLNSPIPLPSSDEAVKGGTNGALDGASDAALRRGFTMEREAERAEDAPVPFSKEGGCVGRPRGWER